MSLLEITENGLYCQRGDFHIDPWKRVDLAVTTHAHSDHARAGSQHYLTAVPGRGVLQERLGAKARIEAIPYGVRVNRNGVAISLHPAGHILGSSQVRVESRGEVWVVSGDYKVEADPTCTPFEPVRCDVFVTESTFGLPVYRWRPQAEIFGEINRWWQANQVAGRTSFLVAYSLGKAQRLLAGVDASLGPIFVHSAITKLLPHYAAARVRLPEVQPDDSRSVSAAAGHGLVIAPASADGTPWLRRFGETSKAFASGWMLIRSARKRQAPDRGFVLSDHADWPGIVSAIRATGAERVLVTHGSADALVRWLRENGWTADPLATQIADDKIEAEG